MTCKFSDFMSRAHSPSNILHIKYAEKIDNEGLEFRV